MKRLHVIYDAHCPLCRQCRLWLGRQATFVPLIFIPLQADDLAERFPGIREWHPEQEIVVISDTGELWQGGAAWVMCLWALREYREWSQRLANPLLLPFARKACEMVSSNRQELSRWFTHEATGDLAHRFAAEPAALCHSDGDTQPGCVFVGSTPPPLPVKRALNREGRDRPVRRPAL